MLEKEMLEKLFAKCSKQGNLKHCDFLIASKNLNHLENKYNIYDNEILKIYSGQVLKAVYFLPLSHDLLLC